MSKILTISRRYRFPRQLTEKLQKLKKFNIVESKFVRLAIEEKLQRDLPKLKEKSTKEILPF